SPRSNYCVTGSYRMKNKQRPNDNVTIWNADGTLRLTLPGHLDQVRCVAVSAGDKTIASGGKDNVVRFWDSTTGTSLGELTAEKDHINEVLFLPDDNSFVYVTDDGWMRLWNWRERRQLHAVQDSPRSKCAALSTDGRRIATGD